MVDEALSLLTNLGEFTLNSFISDGIIKDLPIIGPTFDIIKISKNINDMIFISKLKLFIENVDKNEKWKEKFSNKSECEKISKKILYIINSSDDEDKLKLIGFSFNMFVNGKINKDDYFFIVNMINQSFYPYLKLLLKIDINQFTNNGEIFNMYAINHLLSIGALDQYTHTFGGYDESKTYIPSYKIVCINYFGKFIRNILKQMNTKNKNKTSA